MNKEVLNYEYDHMLKLLNKDNNEEVVEKVEIQTTDNDLKVQNFNLIIPWLIFIMLSLIFISNKLAINLFFVITFIIWIVMYINR